ncbi:unannotated protein [freshwater metagenome]|uniref:Unannotated protein n=1 Tax=freshwater metagenome TaxID=449393 RepID=A0A6J6NDH4_9ZZZZ
MSMIAKGNGLSPQILPRVASHGVPLRELMQLPRWQGMEVVAGADGLDAIVARLNIIEVPDIAPWIKEHEFLLSTGYPLRDASEAFISEIASSGAVGLAIKQGRYLDEIPAQMLHESNELGFPILTIPEDVAFDELLHEGLALILEKNLTVLERSDHVHRALINLVLQGGGLAEVVSQVAEVIEAHVIAVTPDGRLLAASGAESSSMQGQFDPSGRLLIERLKLGLQETAAEELVLFQAVASISSGADELGRIVASSDRVLSNSDLMILERAATVAALTITKRQAVAAVESKYQGDFLREVFAGKAGTPEQVGVYAKALGWNFEREQLVIVATLEPVVQLTPEEHRRAHDRFTAAWVSVTRTADPEAAIVGFANEVVIISASSAHGPRGYLETLTAGLSGDGGGGRHRFNAGVSRVVPAMEALPEGYRQAKQALGVGRRIHGAGSVADFETLGVFRILSLVPESEELRSFLDETLGELATREDAEAEDLRKTLGVLLDTNINVAETSRILHFHYNTLRYRILKLERMVGPFTIDPQLRLSLALSLRILTMRGLA